MKMELRVPHLLQRESVEDRKMDSVIFIFGWLAAVCRDTTADQHNITITNEYLVGSRFSVPGTSIQPVKVRRNVLPSTII